MFMLGMLKTLIMGLSSTLLSESFLKWFFKFLGELMVKSPKTEYDEKWFEAITALSGLNTPKKDEAKKEGDK